MGTQQILMIILSVIVVGTAIAVGIQMFDTQLENSTRSALAAELMQQGAQAQAYYRTPAMMGGGGHGKINGVVDMTNITAEKIAMYINRGANNTNVYRNLHGEFTLTVDVTTPANPVVTIVGVSDVNTQITATATVPLAGTGGNISVVQN